MKSPITTVIAIATLSWPGLISLRSQEPPAKPTRVFMPEEEPEARELPVLFDMAVFAALNELETQRSADYDSLKKQLDTVAVVTDAGLRGDPQQLAKQEQAQARAGALRTAERARQRDQAERSRIANEVSVELAQAAATGPTVAVQPAHPGLAPGSGFQQRLQQIVSRGRGGPGRTLVIRTTDTDPKAQANLEEDLAVMSRILDKTLDQKLTEDHQQRAMGIDVFFAPGSSPIRSLYLEGYGALFLMSVNFPLLPPPDKPESTKEKSDTDSTWEEAKRELYGRPEVWGQFGKTFKFSPTINAEAEYDEKKVEDLKEGLLEALKNATNIRNLKSDETLIACVVGGATVGPRKVRTARASAKRAPDAPDEDLFVSDPDDGAPTRGTILTIRVKKSDADAFAKGRLNLDDFRKKAAVAIYAGDHSGWSAGGAFGLAKP